MLLPDYEWAYVNAVKSPLRTHELNEKRIVQRIIVTGTVDLVLNCIEFVPQLFCCPGGMLPSIGVYRLKSQVLQFKLT